MPYFSKKSLEKLNTCHPDLRRLFLAVVARFDCSVLCGHRNKELQNGFFEKGASRLEYPNSKHNQQPSLAVDVAPYPINWEDRERFHYFAGQVMGLAAALEIKLRWGGDWDDDTRVANNEFDDLPHFELIGE